MKRSDLEHIIRAAATIADDDEIIVIGSQALLAQYPNAPADLLVSNEADVYPKNHPERWDVIDGTIGEGSPFHDTFGYYAQGVDESTATLPVGWPARLVPISNANTRGATGWCLEMHDLAIAKYVAARPKDERYLSSAARHGLLNLATLLERLDETPIDETRRAAITRRIKVHLEDRGG